MLVPHVIANNMELRTSPPLPKAYHSTMTRSNINAAILTDEYNLVRNVGENKPVQIKEEKALLLFDSLSANNIIP